MGRSDNPIARNHANIPYRDDLATLTATLNAERGKKQPSIPSAAWAGNVAVERVPHLRTMRHTWYPFRPITKDWSRDAKSLSIALMYEYYLIGEYRPALLKSPAGLIRHKLFEALRGDLPRDMIVKEDNVSFMWFPDGFYFPPADDIEGVDSEALMAGSALSAVMAKELDAFAKRFKQMKSVTLLTSRYLPDEGPHPEEMISKAFNSLMHVRLYLYLHISLFANLISSMPRRRLTSTCTAPFSAPSTAPMSLSAWTPCPPSPMAGQSPSMPATGTLWR